MKEIIKAEVRGGIKTVNARDIWQALESKQEFANWVKSRLECFTEGQDFILDKSIKVQMEGNREVSRPVIDYYLTIDTAKHVAMLERNDKGKVIRQYFIEVENTYRRQIERDASKLTRRGLTDLIQDTGENERMHGHGFSTYTKLIYKKLGIEYTKEKNFRDTLSAEQLKAVEALEKMAEGYLRLGFDYSQIKQALPDFIISKQKEIEGDL